MKRHAIQLLLQISCLLGCARSSSSSIHSVLRLRGGGGGKSPIIEINPNYVPPSHLPVSSLTLEDVETYQTSPGQQWESPRYYYAPVAPVTLLERIQAYAMQLQRTSPTLSMVSLSCITVFILWQIPQYRAFLQRFFVCSKYNIRQGRYVTTLLSAISHASLTHLLVNLYAFLTFGPQLRHTLHSSANWPLWPLVLGAAFSGSLAFLMFQSRGGCMGLSGVTLAFLALQAKLYPQQELGVALMGILPVRMSAQVALWCLLVWSLVGSFVKMSRVAHTAHLGGLLFGLGYYELWQRRSRLRQISHRAKAMWHGALRRNKR